MATKWVPLKSGGKAIPMRLDFLLTKDDLCRILCYWQREWRRGDGSLPDPPAATVREEIRTMLRYAGWESFYFWNDGVDDDVAKRIWTWAEVTVERVFPQ